MKTHWKKLAGWLAISIIIVVLDQISKLWAVNILKPLGSLQLIPGIIGFRYAENTGAAFSAFSESTVLLSLVSAAVCLIVAGVMVRYSGAKAHFMLPLSMVLAGGVGNLIDRLTLGYVVDFFELQFMRFAIFNIADISITIGAALLFIVLLFGGEKNAGLEN
ncbi:MAG: signal peptidase II [Clostridia bacterium]|nr:signal peptidase II [Clostridia bacterium]